MKQKIKFIYSENLGHIFNQVRSNSCSMLMNQFHEGVLLIGK